MSAFGTNRTSSDVRLESAKRSEADMDRNTAAVFTPGRSPATIDTVARQPLKRRARRSKRHGENICQSAPMPTSRNGVRTRRGMRRNMRVGNEAEKAPPTEAPLYSEPLYSHFRNFHRIILGCANFDDLARNHFGDGIVAVDEA